MSEIHDKLLLCIKHSGKSVRAIAGEANVPYSRLHSALKNKRTISFEDVAAVSDVLRVSLHDLAAEGSETRASKAMASFRFLDDAISSPQREVPQSVGCVSLECFLDWWYSHSGRLENCDAFREEVDLFHEPSANDNRIQPIQSGFLSLASICFQVEATGHLTKTLDGFSASFNRALVEAHLQAIRSREPVLTHPTIDEVLPNGERIQKTYRRLLAPVRNADGVRLIANFAQDIGTIQTHQAVSSF